MRQAACQGEAPLRNPSQSAWHPAGPGQPRRTATDPMQVHELSGGSWAQQVLEDRPSSSLQPPLPGHLQPASHPERLHGHLMYVKAGVARKTCVGQEMMLGLHG